MRRFAFFVLAVVALGVSACNQKPGATGTTPSNGSPTLFKPNEGSELLRKFSDFYLKKKSFRVEYEQKLEMKLNGQTNKIDSKVEIAVQRPNRVAIRQSNVEHGPDIVCDGKQLSISLAPLKKYTQSAAPKTFDEFLTNPIAKAGLGGRGPLLDIFSSDPYKAIMSGVTEVTNLGPEKIGDVDTNHLKFVQEHFDWELWIAVGDSPFLVRESFDMSKTAAKRNDQLKNAKMTIVHNYQNWQFDQDQPNDAFVFVPADGFKKVDNLFGGQADEEDERSPLVGKPAPDVELELLDGGHFSLKKLKDQKIVILDFWATWCGPCVQEMPIVASIAEEYREKGVELYCLNQRESAKVVEGFLKNKQLKVTVCLDSKAVAAHTYGVNGIPMLVLIDKAGTVQSVHIGFNRNIANKLKQELNAILDGKDLFTQSN